jgi:hypothetical protein
LNTVASSPASGNYNDERYDAFLALFRRSFLSSIEDGKRPLFTTDAEGLWETYLSGFGDAERQHYNCKACRNFIERYAGLVTIDEAGITEPAFLRFHAPLPYAPSFDLVERIVRKAKLTGVFLSSDSTLGSPLTGVWRHLFVTLPESMRHQKVTQTAGQAMAEKREDYNNISRALDEFTSTMLDQALTLLETDSLYRAEKVIGPARWLRELHAARDAARSKVNVTWLAIAQAPAGFCHPRASMVGTLLEDIAAGMSFEAVANRFKAKMHPLLYQRPQAAPAAGNIAQAEKIVAQLGVAGSLARRFAKLEDVFAIWKPQPSKAAERAAGGVFGHLKPKGTAEARPNMAIPPVTMTWVKFRAEVLPTAERIEFIPRDVSDSYCGLLTAANPDAPPILQWDLPEKRNPVSWYFWSGGANPEQFGLRGGAPVVVTAICLKPHMWHDEGAFSHQGKGAIALLEGARDTRQPSMCLFPELLRSELHGIRSVLEAHSRSGTPEGKDESTAYGIGFHAGTGNWHHTFRVTGGGRIVDYTLDRWD